MKQSQQVLEWQAEARREGELAGRREGELAGRREGELAGWRTSLLRALRLRFKKKVPAKLVSVIEGLNDLDELSRWFDLSQTADSLEAFRAAVQH